MYKLGLLGFGKMGGSIINGLIESKKIERKDIIIYSLNKEDILNGGFSLAKDELDVYQNSEIVLFAIKPQQFPEVMEKLKDSNKKPNLLITIAAGITISYLQKSLGNELEVVRFMPNLGAQINMAVSTMAHSNNVTKDNLAFAKTMFESIGSVTEVSEDKINILLPLNGSYPAYIWYFIRSFVRYAKKNGIDENDARKMLADATLGCATLLNSSPKDLDTLINDVCSYKGTTIEGVYVFDDKKLDDIVYEASEKCANRGKELEK